ncbi:MAG: hypothetical protein NC902_03390, partial [Candidatus Omnitrophica bacterium]|nr:hypothetical protein [Candidatus Omnitrophota bacterium]
ANFTSITMPQETSFINPVLLQRNDNILKFHGNNYNTFYTTLPFCFLVIKCFFKLYRWLFYRVQ